MISQIQWWQQGSRLPRLKQPVLGRKSSHRITSLKVSLPPFEGMVVVDGLFQKHAGVYQLSDSCYFEYSYP